MSTETAVVASVESTAKTDLTKVETTIESFYKRELVAAKAEYAKLAAETFGFKVVALAVGVAYVVGLITPFVLKHL